MHSSQEPAKELGKLLRKHWQHGVMISCWLQDLQIFWNRFRQKFNHATNRNCHWLALDLAEDQAAETVFEWCNKNQFAVSVLVNNAGYGLSGNFEKYSPQEHTEMLQVNIITLTKLTRLFLPVLHKQPAGYILNIGSSAAYQAVPFLSAYAASKSYVLNFQPRTLSGTEKNQCFCYLHLSGPDRYQFCKPGKFGTRDKKLLKDSICPRKLLQRLL